MSLAYLPILYDDELFGGWLMRTYKTSPFIYPKHFQKEVFNNDKERFDMLHINGVSLDFLSAISHKYSYEKIVYYHTLLGFESLFGPYKPISPTHGFIRYCPLCSKEMEDKHIQVLPQIRELRYCPIHRIEFLNSSLSLNRKINYRIKSIDEFQPITSTSKQLNRDDINIKISKYIYDILNVARNGYKQQETSILLRSYIPQQYFRSASRGQIYIEHFQNALDIFYRDLEGYNLTVRKTQRLLNGESFNSYHISLLGLFLGISPESLVNRVPMKKPRIRRQILKLKNLGLSERAIASKLHISKTNVHKTIEKGGEEHA